MYEKDKTHKNQARREISILLKRGYKQYEIAEELGFHKSSISREVKRIQGVSEYCAPTADDHAYKRRLNSKHCGMKIERDSQLQKRIVFALEQYQSPEGIAGRYGDISHTSIYKWLYSAYGQKYCKHLCFKRYKSKKHKKNSMVRQMIPNAVSIHERSVKGIHWEGDLFVSSHNTVSGAVLVEQSTQFVKVELIPNRRPQTMVDCVENMITDIVVSDITWDRGIENKYHEQLSVPSYFCDGHSPWQKPHVENNIGLLRKWFVPKRTNLDLYEKEKLIRDIHIVNSKWRKSLGYKSAYEAARERGILKE